MIIPKAVKCNWCERQVIDYEEITEEGKPTGLFMCSDCITNDNI